MKSNVLDTPPAKHHSAGSIGHLDIAARNPLSCRTLVLVMRYKKKDNPSALYPLKCMIHYDSKEICEFRRSKATRKQLNNTKLRHQECMFNQLACCTKPMSRWLCVWIDSYILHLRIFVGYLGRQSKLAMWISRFAQLSPIYIHLQSVLFIIISIAMFDCRFDSEHHLSMEIHVFL